MENEEPIVDLNGGGEGANTSLGYAEGDPATAIAPGATVSDDSDDLEGGELLVAFAEGGTSDDQLVILNQGSGQGQFLVDEGTLYYQSAPVGTISGGTDGSTPLVITFNSSATPAIAQALIRSIGYLNLSEDPGDADRIVVFIIEDGDGGTSEARSATIAVTPSDDPGDAQDDTIVTTEDVVAQGSLFADNGGGPDTDPDDELAIASVNGSSENVGTTITLDSGAKLTVNEDGSYSYDPDGQLDYLTDGSSGAVNTYRVDTFQYTLANGDSATATVIVQGVAGPGDRLMGDETDNTITGTPLNDLFLLQQGGNDTANGGGGQDIVYFGGAFTRRDTVDGGDGRDVVVLQGHYVLTLSATNLTGVEALSLQTGANTQFGDSEGAHYSYDITTHDSNVAAGRQLIVNASSLRSGENFTFDGSAERDGSFIVFGGGGADRLEGGDGNDVFVFSGSSWGSSDHVEGGAGRDALVITSGDGLTEIDFGAESLVGIESISVNNLYSSTPDAAPSYAFVLHNDNVAEGDTLIVNGSSLDRRGQTISVDGSAVEGGNLILYGGSGDDVLIGGAGGDVLAGGGGQDSLTGGAGGDTFRFLAATDSTGNPDSINDFEIGLDLIDLQRIDANVHAGGDQAFHWIGSQAFSGEGAGSAGELRAYRVESTIFVEGDTDGDGEADFFLAVIPPLDTELSTSDFLL